MKFIDMGDSVYNYKSDDLLTKRRIVDVDESELEKSTPSYSRHHYSYSRHSRSSRRSSRRVRHQSVAVSEGQTLSEIAEKHGTTVSKLRKLNGIKGSTIRAGKKIRVK